LIVVPVRFLSKLDIDRETATATATVFTIDTETSLRLTMKVAFLIALVLCCTTTVCAKMPWGLPAVVRRHLAGTVNTGSPGAEESVHAADRTNCTLGDDATPVCGGDGDGIPASNSNMSGGFDAPPSNNTHKRVSHTSAHRKGLLSSIGENGLCCVADSLGDMTNAREKASANASANFRMGMGDIRDGMGDIANGMFAIAASMVFSAWLGRSS
jgi:hypothetical protein